MAAEMNNKYDINNFAKFLESFDPAKELDKVDSYLKSVLPEIPQPKFPFVSYNTGTDQSLEDLVKAENAREPLPEVVNYLSDTTLQTAEVALIIESALDQVFTASL